MKRLTKILVAAVMALLSAAAAQAKGEKVVVAYVTSWSDVVPNPETVTHLNYAFGHVNKTFNGVRIDNEQRLRDIVALKKHDPELKVMLSIGGWGSGRFSEMADNARRRKAFAKDCARVVKEFGLDGIDIDWEYPTSDAAGISASERDTDNFTLLMHDIRAAIGADKLLTMATVADAKYIDFRKVVPVVDFVNMMTYDMADAPRHHAALYASENTPALAVDGCAKAHIAAGVPAGKLVMGVPFYGRGGKAMRGFDFKNLNVPEGCRLMRDSVAQAPYLADADGVLLVGYDDPVSLNAKCDYIIENDLHGVMYWDLDGDDESGTLQRVLADRLKHKADKPKVLVLNEGGGQHGPFTERAMSWLRGHAAENGYAVTEIHNAGPITEDFLDDYAAVIQLDFPPYTWPKEAEEAFISYIEEGKGGWIGFHHATLLGEFDGYGMWDWFSDFMGGIRYQNYIAATADGTVVKEQGHHPVMRGVNPTFVLPGDEWYTYDKSPRASVQVLASVDENSYSPASDIRMGDHPVVWVNPAKKARNVYFQFGHSPRLFDNTDFTRMLANAIEWTLKK